MAATAASWKKTAYFAAFVKEEQLGDKGAEGAVGCGSREQQVEAGPLHNVVHHCKTQKTTSIPHSI